MTMPTAANQRDPVDVGAGARAGIIAGLVFLILEMVMVPLFLGGSMWGPPRMIAGIAMGSEVVPPPATFDALIVLVALVVHFALAGLYGVVLSLFIGRMTTGTAVVAGGVFGLGLYIVNFSGFTMLFPWFAMARTWVTVVTHLVFGGVAAAVYMARSGRVARVSVM